MDSNYFLFAHETDGEWVFIAVYSSREDAEGEGKQMVEYRPSVQSIKVLGVSEIIQALLQDK